MLNSTSFYCSILPHHLEKRKIDYFRPNLTLKVAHLALGSLDMIMIARTDMVCYPGTGRSLPIRSSISWNTSRDTNTSASWNTSLLAWRTSRPPILRSLV